MRPAPILPVLLFALFATACEPEPPPCVPACGTRVCGDDGCGGSCGSCEATHDCLEGACVLRPTCTDLERNGEESDVDCGGAGCDPCADGKLCLEARDCRSGRCEQGVCTSCEDGVLNGPESDVDCGGDCAGCADGSACGAPADCSSGRCFEQACSSCSDGAKNGAESDVDCGGDCEACRQGSACVEHLDCVSKTCIENLCEDPTCTDGVLNANETDLDCGGTDCPRCPLGASCLGHDDCQPGACWDAVCAQAECQVQRDCGDIVQTLEAQLCLDKRCEPSCEIDPATGKTYKVAVVVEARLGSFATMPTKPRSAVIRFVAPVALDGTPVTCARLGEVAGKTQSTRNVVDYDAGLNLVYRNLYTLDWGLGASVFDLPLNVPKAGPVILYGEAWYGGVAGELNPTGNRASTDCIEAVDLATITPGSRLTLSFYPE